MISKSNVGGIWKRSKFMAVDSLLQPSKKLKNCWHKKTRKTKKKRLTKIAKELFHEYLKEKSVQKPEDKWWNCLPLFCLPVRQCIIKQLLDSVFAIFGTIKVSVTVISRSQITVTSTLIIPNIAKTSSNNCLLAPHRLLHRCTLCTPQTRVKSGKRCNEVTACEGLDT